MADDEPAGTDAWHRRIAVEQFNRTWDLIDADERSDDDDVEMLLAAMTSRWHWAKIGQPENVAAGDWQVAHVASLLGNGELAIRFATRNLAITQEQGWTGWQLASAHEGMARASAAAGDRERSNRHVAEAERALEDEGDPDNAKVVIDQLASIPRDGQ